MKIMYGYESAVDEQRAELRQYKEKVKAQTQLPLVEIVPLIIDDREEISHRTKAIGEIPSKLKGSYTPFERNVPSRKGIEFLQLLYLPKTFFLRSSDSATRCGMIMKKNIISITVLLLSFILITLTANADGNTSIITQIANMTFKVLIEDKKEHIFDYKTPLKLAEGYELHVTSLDSDGVHLLLTKDWDKVDRKVIATFAGKTYFYNKLIGNLTNVTIIEVRLKSAAISNEDYSVTVDRIRQISEKPVLNPAEIASIEEKEKEERERPKTHQYSAGAPGVNEFVLNWTDKNKYSDIVCDLPFDFHEDGISTITTHYQIRAKNETDSNTTLMFVINWHPGAKRPAEATLTTFPAKLHTEAITSQSDIMIQGKSGMMFAYKEQRDYQGSNAPPLITPPFYLAKYFLDDYTEVTVSGNMVYWSSKDFKAMLSTLRITPPAGYY